MEFKKLRGNRVYLELPTIKESPIHLTPELEAALIEEERYKYQRLKVYAVGELVNDIKEGDEVLTDPSALQKASIITLSEKKKVLLISPFDIVHIW
jgi:hypothetical protein